MFDHHFIQLQSGLKLIRVPMPAVSSVTALVLGNTGSRYEKRAEQGIAHFFEHMVFKGTKKYPTPQVLASTIDTLGAEFNAFTSKEYTGYYVKSASEHLEKTLDVLSDMLLTPTLRQADIDREKGVILEELNMYRDNPMTHVSSVFDQLMYEQSGLEHDIVGVKETILSLSTQNFRQFLVDWYGLGNLILILAGDARLLASEESLKMAERAFVKEAGERKAGWHDARAWLEQHEHYPVFGEKRLRLEKKKTDQAHINLGWPALKRTDPRRFALGLLNVVMGGNMSSRLFSEVREKRGLCYYVRSNRDFFHDVGVWGVAAGVDPTRAGEALEVIQQQFELLRSGNKPITQSELERAKQYVVGNFILSLEDSQSVSQFYGMHQLFFNKTINPNQLIEKYRKVGLDEVQSLAREIIKPGEMRLAVVGDFENDEVRDWLKN